MPDCDIDILGLSETHLHGKSLENIQASRYWNQTNTTMYRNYPFFPTWSDNNKIHGVDLLINKELYPNFRRISDRIYTAQIRLRKRVLIFIKAYAPTLQVSKQNPELREELYEQLNREIGKLGNRHLLVVVGDFNAETGSSWRGFNKNMCKYGKGNKNPAAD